MTECLSVLVIEDEPLIAMMIEDFVDLLGHQIAGSCDTVVAGLEKVAVGAFDVAILDVNLRDGACWPVADALAAANKPFVIASGGFVEPPPAHHAGARHLAKPFTLDGVRAALEALGRS
ncbi:response regulator [Sphingomonas sp. BIUV-7]|uniref:Response regulator n=1 Tax=Sphingomonas natans TaxID=3063330 RepID=A0ABT8YAB2_9SPHN|nr:response regulator [Sphingomonas sp. BIUV-7]MDO6414644.1 response regulator [Sphingomonas sp. BIUV-7]